MNLLCYPKLSTRSRRAICRLYRPRYSRYRARIGNPHYYRYVPRGSLLERLSEELGLSKEDVQEQLAQEREHLLKLHYPDDTKWKPWEV